MTMTRTAIDRATALAAAKGIKTQARTLKGVLAAIRKASAKPAKPATQARQRKLIGINALLAGFDQGMARVRTIDPHQPILSAVSAALGQDQIGTIGAVPNNYRGRAEESVASATRQGDAILVFWGRVEMPRRPFGRGEKEIVPDGTRIVRRRTLIEAIRLPAGWRWGADDLGPFVTGPGVEPYHPTGASLAQAIQTQDWTQIQAKAQAAR